MNKALEALDELYGQALEFQGLGTTHNYNIVREALQSMQCIDANKIEAHLQWIEFQLHGKEDITDNGLPNDAMQVLQDVRFIRELLPLPAPPQEEV